MDNIVSVFKNLWNAIVHALVWCLDVITNVLQSMLNYVVDKICGFVEWVVSHISFNVTLFTDGLNWLGLPTQALYVMKHIGVDQCLFMVSTAMLIRLLMNLIPSWLSRI